MTQEELSAQQMSVDKAIGFLREAENDERLSEDLYGLIDIGKAWAEVAQAISLHNSSILTTAVAEAALQFVSNPDPEVYAELAAAVAEYSESR